MRIAGKVTMASRRSTLSSVRQSFEIQPFDAEQAHLARRAYREFGKGQHTAGLNFGDCAVYALAVASGEPLLFKGSDTKER